MTTLYEMLVAMNTNAKSGIVQKPPIASKQERWVIEVLNDNLGEELETAEIAQLAGMKVDTASTIMNRLAKNYAVTSRIGSSARKSKGIHSKTRVKIWTAHERIVPRQTA